MDNSTPSINDSSASSSELRSRLYDKMTWDLAENGAAFLRGGETSSDIFDTRDGVVTPVLKMDRNMIVSPDDACRSIEEGIANASNWQMGLPQVDDHDCESLFRMGAQDPPQGFLRDISDRYQQSFKEHICLTIGEYIIRGNK